MFPSLRGREARGGGVHMSDGVMSEGAGQRRQWGVERSPAMIACCTRHGPGAEQGRRHVSRPETPDPSACRIRHGSRLSLTHKSVASRLQSHSRSPFFVGQSTASGE